MTNSITDEKKAKVTIEKSNIRPLYENKIKHKIGEKEFFDARAHIDKMIAISTQDIKVKHKGIKLKP